MPNDGGATWTSYGKAFGSSNSWRTKLWSSIALFQSRSKYASKEQWRGGKQSEKIRGQQLQSSFALLENFPKSIFYMLYTISKLRKSRIQRFKPCTIWSWNEEDMAFGRQLLQVCENFAHPPLAVRMVCEVRTPSSGVRKFCTPLAWCEFCSVFADSTLDIFFCIFWCNFLSSPCNKPITSFCFCKDYIRGGNHLLEYI